MHGALSASAPAWSSGLQSVLSEYFNGGYVAVDGLWRVSVHEGHISPGPAAGTNPDYLLETMDVPRK